MDVQRLSVPSSPGGRVQRKIPAPYERPSIAIGGGAAASEKREWRQTSVMDVKAGDTVPDIGVVTEVTHTELDAETLDWFVRITGGQGGSNAKYFHGSDSVLAFVKLRD